MTYAVKVTASADRDLGKLSAPIRKRIILKIASLADDPRPSGAEKLKGFRSVWRVRVGDYRIIYEIEDDILYVYVVRIGHRRDVYRNL